MFKTSIVPILSLMFVDSLFLCLFWNLKAPMNAFSFLLGCLVGTCITKKIEWRAGKNSQSHVYKATSYWHEWLSILLVQKLWAVALLTNPIRWQRMAQRCALELVYFGSRISTSTNFLANLEMSCKRHVILRPCLRFGCFVKLKSTRKQLMLVLATTSVDKRSV